MKKIIEYLIAYTLKIILSLRYRVKIVGAENLSPEKLTKPGGVLFLPNHPTYFIDPIFVTLATWPKYPIRPMIVEYMYYTPVINSLMRFMNALPIPNFVTSSNSLKRKKSEQVIQTLIDDLKKGENFLLYPAGKVKHTAYENIGAASGVHRILQEAPEANVVLVRMKGLWGSSFSRAIVSSAPPFFKSILWGLKVVLKNFLFFTPRREIIIEMIPAPADFPYQAPKLELNRYLEKWYNRPDGLTPQKGNEPGDSLVLVSYSMWKEQYLSIKEEDKPEEVEISVSDIPQPIKEQVIQKIAEMTEYKPETIKPDMNFATDLGMDSLDTAELVAFLQDEFDISGVSTSELTTVAKMMGIASKKIQIKEEVVENAGNLKQWLAPVKKYRVGIAPGETIMEAFLNNCARQGNRAACADMRLGVQSYPKLKLRVLVIAEYIRKLPGDYIGILLPASVGANILILGCLLAGKIPLMINWTVGPRHLESVVKLSNVEVVLSSWAFLDRLDNVDLDGIEDKLIMLEDAVREISFSTKIKALLRSKLPVSSILKAYGIDKKTKDDIAVLLFTSGTESMPKGVPLTHHNILSNLRAALKAEVVYSDDVVYGILPPFHSFGFSVSCLLSILTGLRVAYSPDPTDGKRLAHGFEQWKITIMVGAPTFIKAMLKFATPEQLKTMRMCVTGAEKAPPDLVKMLEYFGKGEALIEGYGITECAPVLTLNPMGKPHKGVGMPLPGIELCVIHPETEELLPVNTRGLILARGPNIFSGYLNPGLSSPFITIDGKQWYKTGDLGSLDENNYLTISGRQKRFVKIGGEMVSLASVEDALLQMALRKGWPSMQEGPLLAVCAKEFPGDKTKLYLFSRYEVSLEEVNKLLKESGFSNLVKITSVTCLPEIPLMGTGKINYRILESEHIGTA